MPSVDSHSVGRPLRDSPYGRIGVVADNQGAVFSLITSPAPVSQPPA